MHNSTLKSTLFFSLFVGTSSLFAPALLGQISDSLWLQQASKEVVIQSTRVSDDVPVPHNNFSQKELQKLYHAQDIPQLLTLTPSLVESSDAGAGVGYTAMRIRGADQTRINVTLNGIPLNDAEGQGVFWVDLPDLASSAAEIQVQRGVGASTNGAGAFGATVNIDLNRSEPERFVEAIGTYGSFNTFRGTFRAGTGYLKNGLYANVRGSYLRSDGWVDRATTDMSGVHLHLGQLKRKSSWAVHFLNGEEETYQAWYGLPVHFFKVDSLKNYNAAGTEKSGTPYENEIDDYTQRHFLAHYKYDFGRGLNLQLNGHYTRGFGYFEQYKAGQFLIDYGIDDPNFIDSDLVRQRWLDNHFFGGTWALRWASPINPPSFSKAPEFTFGGGAHRYLGDHFGKVVEVAAIPNFQTNDLYYDNSATKNDLNAFFQSKLHWKKGLSTFFDAQLRYVGYEFLGFDADLQNVEQSDNLLFFNPKAGLNFRLNSQSDLYAFAGIANREPNRSDYTESSPASRPKAERLFDLEAGYKLEHKNAFFLANLFYMRYKNQLVLDGSINDVGAYIRTNVDDSYRTGIELETGYSPIRRLQLAGTLALSQNKVKNFTSYIDNWDTWEQESVDFKNTDLAFSPNIIAQGSVEFAFFKMTNPLHLNILGKYVGKQYIDNTGLENVALSDYFTSDLRLRFAPRLFKNNQTEFMLSVVNWTGVNYIPNAWAYRYRVDSFDPSLNDPYTRRESGNTFTQIGLFPQAGRQFYLTIKARFE